MSEYQYTCEGGKSILVHKQVWIKHKGLIPNGFIIHHINFNKKDNRIDNLICVSRSEHRNIHILDKKSRLSLIK